MADLKGIMTLVDDITWFTRSSVCSNKTIRKDEEANNFLQA
eukprot:CAMPEP_0170072568 /NCGR_PEP_ID=MMETSP0019_2-20121128/10175_1 /TAXON_ID=98059 /ORGANISM="Dinobryon sp., Strain UTEXLB2267" /LENGTH=40 /DNA_ID= /DNA_START= /DNA_END= /DNA_ORIENTATION=